MYQEICVLIHRAPLIIEKYGLHMCGLVRWHCSCSMSLPLISGCWNGHLFFRCLIPHVDLSLFVMSEYIHPYVCCYFFFLGSSPARVLSKRPMSTEEGVLSPVSESPPSKVSVLNICVMCVMFECRFACSGILAYVL